MPGLAPKTARYMYGMIGGENVHVPDTHMIRYNFGLDKTKDKRTIEYLKSLLWNENNAHLLEGMDRHYAANSPAVSHVLAHPELAKYFGGDPQRAIFPAFWKNWALIQPHEKLRGLSSKGAFNEGTTHQPFWDAVNKSEIDMDLPHQTAAIHAHWVQQYGAMPAMTMYHAHLVPRLLSAATAREQARAKIDPIVKMEQLVVDLRKAVGDLKNAQEEQPMTVRFANKDVMPGFATNGKQSWHLVHEDKHGYIGYPAERGENFEAEDLVKLPRHKEGTHYNVHERPRALLNGQPFTFYVGQ